MLWAVFCSCLKWSWFTTPYMHSLRSLLWSSLLLISYLLRHALELLSFWAHWREETHRSTYVYHWVGQHSLCMSGGSLCLANIIAKSLPFLPSTNHKALIQELWYVLLLPNLKWNGVSSRRSIPRYTNPPLSVKETIMPSSETVWTSTSIFPPVHSPLVLIRLLSIYNQR